MNERLFGTPGALDFFSAAEALLKMEEGLQDNTARELYHSCIETALQYATMRAHWHMMDLTEKTQKDTLRSALHNSFIDACNILARYMIKKSSDTTWRDRLGEDRKIIGDFACYISAIVGIRER